MPVNDDWSSIRPIKIAGGFAFPEGVSASPDGSVYLVNCDNNIVSRVSPDGEVTIHARLPGKGNGSKLRADGALLVCDYFANCIVEVATDGAVTPFVTSDTDDRALSRGPNDVVIMRDGDLYFTTPQGSGKDRPIGKVYHYSATSGHARVVAEGLAFPNGVSAPADESYLYVAESAQSRIWRFPILSPGVLGAGRIFINLDGGQDPDGIEFDAVGNLYIAYCGGGAIVVVDPGGDIVAELPAGGSHPTNVSFGGPNGDQLFVTEAETNSLYRLDIGRRGVRLPGWPSL